MTLKSNLCALLMTVAGLAFGGHLALAAVLAKTGTFDFVGKYVHGYVSFEHAGKIVVGGPLKGTMTVGESEGELFPAGGSSESICLAFGKKSDDGTELEAACSYTDEDGDSWYTTAKRIVGDTNDGGGGEGKLKFVGGTGKYKRLNGSCTYMAEYKPYNEVVVTGSCTWDRV